MSLSHIKAPVVTTTWILDEVQFRAALQSYIEVDPFADSTFSCVWNPAQQEDGYIVTLTENSDSHARRILDEQRARDSQARAVEWNDMRLEVLRLFKVAIDNSVCVDVDAAWLEDARRIVNAFER